MPPLKNPQHETFARLVAQGKSKREAAESAGYSKPRASAQGCNLAKDRKIAQRIEELQNEVAAKTVTDTALSRDWVVSRLRENVERALQVTPVLDSEGKPNGEYKYEGNVVNRGLELLGKHLGMFDGKSQDDAQPIERIVYKWVAPKSEDTDELEHPKSTSGKNAKAGAILQ